MLTSPRNHGFLLNILVCIDFRLPRVQIRHLVAGQEVPNAIRGDQDPAAVLHLPGHDLGSAVTPYLLVGLSTLPLSSDNPWFHSKTLSISLALSASSTSLQKAERLLHTEIAQGSRHAEPRVLLTPYEEPLLHEAVLVERGVQLHALTLHPLKLHRHRGLVFQGLLLCTAAGRQESGLRVTTIRHPNLKSNGRSRRLPISPDHNHNYIHHFLYIMLINYKTK